MKKRVRYPGLISIIALISLSGIVKAQESWTLVNPSPTANDINEIYFIDDDIGYAVGKNGLILKTTDGMNSWTALDCGTEKNLKSVYFITSQKGIVAGEEGVIYITTDGGSTWSDKSSVLPAGIWYTSVKFSDENTIWLAGSNKVFKSTNSGSSWETYEQPSPFWVIDIFPINNQKCFWCGFGGIYKTENGGATWSSVSVSLYVYEFNNISFSDELNGWLIGTNNALVRTTDGGATWIEYSNIEQEWRESRVSFQDASNGWCATNKGIFFSSDGGANWALSFNPEENRFGKFYSLKSTANRVYAAGPNGAMYRSLDGSNWETAYNSFISIDVNFNEIYFNDADLGFIAGTNGTLLKTADGGTSWSLKNTNVSEDLKSIYFCDANTGFAMTFSDILRTTNSGESWQSVFSRDYMRVLRFYNSQKGIAINESDVYMTENGGSSWNLKIHGGATLFNVNDVTFISENEFCAVGNIGKIYKTTDNGDNWYEVSSLISKDLTAIEYFDNGSLFAVGNQYILKSSDRGENWQIVYTGTVTDKFEDINRIDTGELWVVGYDGASSYNAENIMRSEDNGATWTHYNTPNYKGYMGSHFIDANTGFVVGYNATINKYTNNINLPACPTGLSAEADGKTINVHWNDVPDIIGYKLFRSDEFSGNYKLIYEGSSATHSDSGLEWNTEYFYRVLAHNNSGHSARSREISGRTGTLVLNSPSLIYPEDGAFNLPTEITFRWNEVLNAEHYSLQIHRNEDFVYPSVNETNITATEFVVSTLSNNFTYYWRIKAHNEGLESEWSQPCSFQVITALPEQVELYEPVDGSINQPLTVSLNWIYALWSDFYHLQVSENPDFTSIVDEEMNLNSTSNQMSLLQNNTAYFWRVRGSNAAGWGEWSNVWSFMTDISLSIEKDDFLPDKFNLSQNYPNPFNAATNIEFDIPVSSEVAIIIYDNLGRMKDKILDQNLSAGRYRIKWNAENYSSGIYFIRMISGKKMFSKKAILLK